MSIFDEMPLVFDHQSLFACFSLSWKKNKHVSALFFFLHSELNALQEELKDRDFVILGFPCNQFGKQEPGNNHEILSIIK